MTDHTEHVNGELEFTLDGIKYEHCTVKVERYINGKPALTILLRDGDLLSVPTVNLRPEQYLTLKPNSNAVWLKDYSENTGAVSECVRNGLGRLTGRTVPSGYISLIELELTGWLLAEVKNSQAVL